jgi:hypothetical protein
MSKITLEIKNQFGKLYAYPADEITKLLLPIKDEYDAEGNATVKAKCFVAGDMPQLRKIAEYFGAELVEINNLKNKSLANWIKKSKRPY